MKTLKQFRTQLTKPKLRAWLQSQASNKVVGKSTEECDCPIARYGHSLGMSKDMEVSGGTMGLGVWPEKEYVSLPTWADKFIEGVDKIPAGDNITASRALKVLALTQQKPMV
jgi:hypothetical protein